MFHQRLAILATMFASNIASRSSQQPQKLITQQQIKRLSTKVLPLAAQSISIRSKAQQINSFLLKQHINAPHSTSRRHLFNKSKKSQLSATKPEQSELTSHQQAAAAATTVDFSWIGVATGTNFYKFAVNLPQHVRFFPLFTLTVALISLYRLKKKFQAISESHVRARSPIIDTALTMLEQAPFYKDLVQINPYSGQLNRLIVSQIVGAVPPSLPEQLTIDHIKDKRIYEFDIYLSIDSGVPGSSKLDTLVLRVGVKNYASDFYDGFGIFHPFGVPDSDKNSYAAKVATKAQAAVQNLFSQIVPSLVSPVLDNSALAPFPSIFDPHSPLPIYHIVHLDVVEQKSGIGYAIRFADSPKDPWAIYQTAFFHKYLENLQRNAPQQYEAIIARQRGTPLHLINIQNSLYNGQVTNQIGEIRSSVDSMALSVNNNDQIKARIIELETLLSLNPDSSTEDNPKAIQIENKQKEYKTELKQLTALYRTLETANTLYNPLYIETTYQLRQKIEELRYIPVIDWKKQFITSVLEVAQSIVDFDLRSVVGDLFTPHHSFPRDILPFAPGVSYHHQVNPAALQYPLVTSLQSLAANEQYVSHPGITLQPLSSGSNHNFHLAYQKLIDYYGKLQNHYITNINFRKEQIKTKYKLFLPTTHPDACRIDNNNPSQLDYVDLQNLFFSLQELNQEFNQELIKTSQKNDQPAFPESLEEFIKLYKSSQWYNIYESNLSQQQRENVAQKYEKELASLPHWTIASLPERFHSSQADYDYEIEWQSKVNPNDEELQQLQKENLHRKRILEPQIGLSENQHLNSVLIPNAHKMTQVINLVLDLEHRVSHFVADVAVGALGDDLTPEQAQLVQQLNAYELRQQHEVKEALDTTRDAINANTNRTNHDLATHLWNTEQQLLASRSTCPYNPKLSINNPDSTLRLSSVMTGTPFYGNNILLPNDLNTESFLTSQLDGLLIPSETLMSPDSGISLRPLRGQMESWDQDKPTFLPLSVLPCAQWYPLFGSTPVEPIIHSLNDDKGSFGSACENIAVDAIEIKNNEKAKNIQTMIHKYTKSVHHRRTRPYYLDVHKFKRSLMTKEQREQEKTQLVSNGDNLQNVLSASPHYGIDITQRTTDNLMQKVYVDSILAFYKKANITPPESIPSPLQHVANLAAQINELRQSTIDTRATENAIIESKVPKAFNAKEDVNSTNQNIRDSRPSSYVDVASSSQSCQLYQLPNFQQIQFLGELSSFINNYTAAIKPYSLNSTTILPLRDNFGVEQIDMNSAEIAIRQSIFALSREHFSAYLREDLAGGDVVTFGNTIDKEEDLKNVGQNHPFYHAWKLANTSTPFKTKNLHDVNHNPSISIQNPADVNTSIQYWFKKLPPLFKYSGMGLRAVPLNYNTLTREQYNNFELRQRKLFGDQFIPKPIPQEEQSDIISHYVKTPEHRSIFHPAAIAAIDPTLLHRFVIFTHDNIFQVCYDGTVWFKNLYPVGHILNGYGRIFNGTPDQKLAASLGISHRDLVNAGEDGLNPIAFSQQVQQQRGDLEKNKLHSIRKLYVRDDFTQMSNIRNEKTVSNPGLSFAQMIPGGTAISSILPLVGCFAALHFLPVTNIIRVAQYLPQVYNRIGVAKPISWNVFRFFFKPHTNYQATQATANLPSKTRVLSVRFGSAKSPLTEPYLKSLQDSNPGGFFNTFPQDSDFARTAGNKSTMDFYIKFDKFKKDWVVDKVQLRIDGVPNKSVEFTLPINRFQAFDSTIPNFDQVQTALFGPNHSSSATSAAVRGVKSVVPPSNPNVVRGIKLVKPSTTPIPAETATGDDKTTKSSALFLSMLSVGHQFPSMTLPIHSQCQDF